MFGGYLLGFLVMEMNNIFVHLKKMKDPNQIGARNFTSSKGVKNLYVCNVARHSMIKNTL